MEKLLIGMVVLLVILAGVQAYAVMNLKASLSEITVTKTRPVSSPAPVPTNLQNLPQMVGGC